MSNNEYLAPAPGVAAVDVDPSDSGSKVIAFLFGAAVYIAVWCILIYVLCFVGNFFTPLLGTKWAAVLPLKSIDMGVQEPFWRSFWIDIGLVAILGLQHSIMPRPWYKAWITRFVPPHMERGVYIIFATCALSLLMWQWQPLPQTIWHVDNWILAAILDVIQVCGWLTVLLATVQVGHWKIFGITQTLDYIRDKPYTRYTYTRLPPEFFAVTPSMTYGHLIFAAGLTTYIMIGIFFLETNLTQLYGTSYAEYVKIRSKIIPWFVGTPTKS
jgi:protein-S-isoprenylcysteine O-methyltransferase Ste14